MGDDNYFNTQGGREPVATADSVTFGNGAAPGNKTTPKASATAGNSPTAKAKATAGNSPTAKAKATAGNTPTAKVTSPPGNSPTDEAGGTAVNAEAEAVVNEKENNTATENNQGDSEAMPTPNPTEAIVTPAPGPISPSINGGVWIAIIAGLVVLTAVAVLLLKRFVFKREAGDGGNATRASQHRGNAEVKQDRPMARADRGIGRVSATKVQDDLQAQSQYSVGCAQWIGRREDQEDAMMVSEWRDANAVASRGILAAVADGIGGLDDGQVASQTLMRSFEEGFERLDPEMSAQGKLLELTAQGHREVVEINRRGRDCGTTLVAVLIQGGYLSTISVGDSRIALYRSGVLLQLNREHVNARVRDEESAFNGAPPVEGRRRAALTAYIGKEELRELDRTLNPIRLISGDCVLLMSDGVFGTLNDDQLVALLEQDAQKAADSIIDQVQKQKNQYQDNATVVVIGVK